jgi:glycosyltransferase involved in cell wall biosynthesis
MIRVSVVIPTYNYGRFLSEAIQSVLDQTYKDFEIIVIDDGSTDNTEEVVNSFKDSRIRYIYQDHSGVSVAENAGVNAARGEYITGMGADDLYLPRNLEIKVKLLDSRPEIGMVCSDAYLFDNRTGATIGRFWRDDPSHYLVDPQKAALHPIDELIIHGCFIAPQASMMRRTVFEKVGRFDNTLAVCEDWDLLFRIVQHFPIEIIDEPLIKLRRHDTNMSLNRDTMYVGEVATLSKLLHSHSLSKKQVKLANKRLVSLHFYYGRWAILSGHEVAGRNAMISRIRTSPWELKSYLYLAFSLLGSRRFLALKSWKKNLGHRSTGCQLSGST